MGRKKVLLKTNQKVTKKIKNFCSLRNTAKRMKIQATEWEKMFSNHVSDKWFISRIYKELSNAIIRK